MSRMCSDVMDSYFIFVLILLTLVLKLKTRFFIVIIDTLGVNPFTLV